MSTLNELITLCRAKKKDAKALLKCKRYDGAVYTCGYIVELALKIKICKTLKWTDYPPPSDCFKSFKTHNLAFLLACTGIEGRIKKNYLALWSFFTNWSPEMRYEVKKQYSMQEATDMVNAAVTLQSKICKI
ncbi:MULTISPECIES: hypothetical protein [Parachlamydia]|uniref:hypothetical protein n=1 Tax=Parachlamydia TaxID=83551 RepID=UPI000750C444|nr:hypothetical protein [Parachlamydia acanthamoebae]